MANCGATGRGSEKIIFIDIPEAGGRGAGTRREAGGRRQRQRAEGRGQRAEGRGHRWLAFGVGNGGIGILVSACMAHDRARAAAVKWSNPV